MPQSQTAALPRHQEEEETHTKKKKKKKNKHKSNKRTKSAKISSIFPKQSNRNAERTKKYNNKTQGKT